MGDAIAPLTFSNGNVAVTDAGRGKNDRRARREADDELQVLKDKMPTLVRIERTQSSYLAWNTRAVARIRVIFGDSRRSKIETTSGIDAVRGIVELELRLVGTNRVHVYPELMVDARIMSRQKLCNKVISMACRHRGDMNSPF